METSTSEHMYSNEITVSVPDDGKDVALYFKWISPDFDADNHVAGKKLVRTMIITCPRQLLYDLSSIGLDLLDDKADIDKNKIKHVLESFHIQKAAKQDLRLE
jgi:hypothetical protein